MNHHRILFAINSLARGGAERLALDICNEIKRRNEIELILVVFDKQNDYPELSKDLPVVYCNSSMYMKFPGRTIADVQSFQRILQSFQPTIIHSHLFYADQITREIIHPEVNYFSHIHGTVSPYELLKANQVFNKKKIIELLTRSRILKKYKQCNNQFIANSQVTKENLLKVLPIWETQIHLLENGVNLERFYFTKKQFPAKQLNLITTGSLIPRKNHVFLLEIIKMLKQSNHPVHLDILGKGKLYQDIQNKIKEYQLENYVSLHGSVPHVENYLQDAHIYVHSATNEPFGLAIVEAMAVGLPVVCLDGGGNRAIVDDGINGFMVDKPDMKLFAKKIMEIVSSSAIYQSFSLKARIKAEQYNIENYITRLLEIYNDGIQA